LNRKPSHLSSPVPPDLSSRPAETAQPKEMSPTGEIDPRPAPGREDPDCGYNPRFVEFFGLLAKIGAVDHVEKLFPKMCRVCAQEFQGFSEYLCATTPKGHVFEDCKEVMGKPFTMVYRHCPCGNTLVLTLTEENFPSLDRMWAMLHAEATKSGIPLEALVKEFSRQCDRYILCGDNPR
jgi:hypothetical protein